MDETDYFQKRDKYKEKIVDDGWDALKKIKTHQETKKKPVPDTPEKQSEKNINQSEQFKDN